jgi:stage II sporulation protein M
MVKRRENNGLKRMYRESFDYIKSSSDYIYGVFIIFLIFGAIGFFFPVPEIFYSKLLHILEELIEKTEGMNAYELIVFIFLNNAQASLTGILFGIILGIVPFISTSFNGYLIGFVSKVVIEREGFLSLWRLLPHGVFELPAIFISFGLGMRMGLFYFEKKNKGFRYYLYNSIKVFLLIVIPLLLIASIIEGSLIALTN